SICTLVASVVQFAGLYGGPQSSTERLGFERFRLSENDRHWVIVDREALVGKTQVNCPARGSGALPSRRCREHGRHEGIMAQSDRAYLRLDPPHTHDLKSRGLGEQRLIVLRHEGVFGSEV